MSLNRRLEAWIRAGIIDEGTSDRIRAFEEARKRPTALYALVGLGALAIGIGFVAIVAANWDAIPSAVKLGVDLLIGVALAFGIERLLRRDEGWSAEGLVIVYYLFVLASIGLIGQVYQLGSPLRVALGVWSLATLPLLFLARSRFAGGLWAAGLITTYVANAYEWIELAKDADRPDLSVSLGVALPVLIFGLSWVLRRSSDKVSRTFQEVAWVVLAVGAFAGSFTWYVRIQPEHLVTWGAGVTIVLVAVPILFGRALFGKRSVLASATLVVVVITLLLPLVMTHGSLRLVGGLVGLAVLGFFAFAAYSIGHHAAFSILTAAIGIRMVTIYFEVFGSLMSTGLGMVTGGVLTLLIAWLWARTSSRLKDTFDVEKAHAQ
ncbi:MAG: DUF2157 domain-containing protein [Myxococcales bacterium]|nr:DUF2157 domain-containing protein [Myxococcales bacterium]MDH3484494.1 DUF2157 domain-containing protein [Myxococcales bacterium]